ncbi:MAG: membrane protein insertion efficiency factor YidD [Planctomycetota bacterium]
MTRSPLAWLLSVPVWIYRKVISPMKPPTCRFHPTCSSYALEALRVHGAVRGSWLTVWRLCRCHPFCEPGFDPVPPRRVRRTVTPPRPSGTDRSPNARP